MPQRIAFGATLLLPETVGDFTDPTRGVLFVFNESGALDLREAFGIRSEKSPAQSIHAENLLRQTVDVGTARGQARRSSGAGDCR